MKRFILFFFLLFCAFSISFAQETGITIDPELAEKILGLSFMGFTVLTLSQLLKNVFVKLLNLTSTGQNVAGYVSSLIVSVAANVFYFTQVVHEFVLTNFIIYSLIVWGLANGWFKFRRQLS